MKHIKLFEEFINESDDSYAVIGKWTEPDGSEEWDVLHNGPISYEEAKSIAADAGKMWDKSVPSDRKNLKHTEIVIKYKDLQKKLKNEG